MKPGYPITDAALRDMAMIRAGRVPKARETARKSGVRTGGRAGETGPILWANVARTPSPEDPTRVSPGNPDGYPIFLLAGPTETDFFEAEGWGAGPEYPDASDVSEARLIVNVGVAGPPNTALRVLSTEMGMDLMVPLDVYGLQVAGWQDVSPAESPVVLWRLLNPDGYPHEGQAGDPGTLIGFGLMQLQVKKTGT